MKATKYVTTRVLSKMLREGNSLQLLDLDLDPQGKHVLVWTMLTNDDKDVKGWWMLKFRGSMQPVERLLTVPLSAFNQAMTQAREAV